MTRKNILFGTSTAKSFRSVRLGATAAICFLSVAIIANADTVTYTGAGNQTWSHNDADGDWSGGDNQYSNGDDVIFTNTGAGTVTISGSLAPNSVLFNNTAGNDFTFQTGNLTGGGDLTLSGGGNVTFATASMLPVLGNVTVIGGVLNYVNNERIGSLAGSGTLNGTLGNNILRYGWNNADSTFSGTVTQAAGSPGVPSFEKVGKGTTTITGVIGNLGSGGASVADGTLRFFGAGSLTNVGLVVMNGATAINDDTGSHLDDRTRQTSIGGEYIVLGNASTNSAIGGPNNTSLHFNQLGNPTLTLIPGAGFEAQYRQRNGGNNGMFSIMNGVTALVRGDNLGGLSGTRSRFTIRTNELSIFLLGGAGATFSDDVALGQAGTPQVSVLYKTVVDASSTGNGSGFATYDRGIDHQLDDDDTGVRPLTASEYSNTLADGDGAVVSTIANTRLSSAITGINSATRINSLILDQNGSIAGSGGTLTVHSGLIMSTGTNGAITTSNLDVPSVVQSGTFAAAASVTHTQLSLITPDADDFLAISSNISAAGPLVKSGAGTVALTGTNSYAGSTFIAKGALRATDGVGIPTTSTIHFTGGVLEGSGVFARTIGTGTTHVRWDEFGSGGFAAHGGTLDIHLNGGVGLVAWDNTANFVQGNRHLLLNSASANNVVDFKNALSLGTFDAGSGDRSDSIYRTIEVFDNPNVTTDLARISGAISGSDARLQLRKIGAGTLEFSGANTYVGTTSVEEGTLLITGSTFNQGSFFVQDGGRLGGTGMIGLNSSAAVFVEDGGVLSPGVNGAGTLSIDGDLVLNNDSILAFDLVTSDIVGGPNDLISVNGDLVLDGVLSVADASLLSLGSYRLFNYTGTLTDNGLVVLGAGMFLDLSTAGQVNLVLVPEPSTLLLASFGLIGVWRRRRSRSTT